MTRPDMAADRPNAADWRNRAERAEAECAELRAGARRTAHNCSLCDDTGYKDYAGFGMDPCDHSQPTPAAEKADVVEAWRELDEWCASRVLSVGAACEAHVKGGGMHDDPIYRANLGEHRAYSRMRSYISGAKRAALQSSPAEHSDDLAVDRFASAMRAKLAQKREEGRGGWANRNECSAERLSTMLRDHVGKGDPVDVANFAMMLHQRGEKISQAQPRYKPNRGERPETIADSAKAGKA